MDKYLCGYCWKCHKTTKQKIVHCNENTLNRLGLALLTIGLSELLVGHDYLCECAECGSINTVEH